MPALKDITPDSLPAYELQLEEATEDGVTLYWMKFFDPTWIPHPRFHELPQDPQHVRFFVDGCPTFGAGELSALPAFSNNMELCRYIASSTSTEVMGAACQKLRESLAVAIEPYFQDLRLLQAALQYCKAAISGSWLLAFLLHPQQTPWQPADLDIYVSPSDDSQGYKLMFAFVLASGFKWLGNLTDSGPVEKAYFSDEILRVHRFEHRTNARRIDIVEARRSVLDVLGGFHSTIVCNALTAHHILVMFPEWTERREAWSKAVPQDYIRDKYESRGFRFVTTNTDLGHPCGSGCPDLSRSVRREETCLFVPLSAMWASLESSVFPLTSHWTGPVDCTNVECEDCALPGHPRRTVQGH
ncbi:hypothetical protein EXIGLDRAFT_771626 [Exidia glandulosa HHB12029]|uniref:Uncharacterized protein n=1 Tax=Exidia glandulosa HHB12029 TaxID=1314781 RepID=A0A165FUW7_EXIGL|nr:hypothetical protein EXIGLDRAFT_771626 [Exidia glandulosa HHB12029]